MSCYVVNVVHLLRQLSGSEGANAIFVYFQGVFRVHNLMPMVNTKIEELEGDLRTYTGSELGVGVVKL